MFTREVISSSKRWDGSDSLDDSCYHSVNNEDRISINSMSSSHKESICVPEMCITVTCRHLPVQPNRPLEPFALNECQVVREKCNSDVVNGNLPVKQKQPVKKINEKCVMDDMFIERKDSSVQSNRPPLTMAHCRSVYESNKASLSCNPKDDLNDVGAMLLVHPISSTMATTDLNMSCMFATPVGITDRTKCSFHSSPIMSPDTFSAANAYQRQGNSEMLTDFCNSQLKSSIVSTCASDFNSNNSNSVEAVCTSNIQNPPSLSTSLTGDDGNICTPLTTPHFADSTKLDTSQRHRYSSWEQCSVSADILDDNKRSRNTIEHICGDICPSSVSAPLGNVVKDVQKTSFSHCVSSLITHSSSAMSSCDSGCVKKSNNICVSNHKLPLLSRLPSIKDINSTVLHSLSVEQEAMDMSGDNFDNKHDIKVSSLPGLIAHLKGRLYHGCQSLKGTALQSMGINVDLKDPDGSQEEAKISIIDGDISTKPDNGFSGTLQHNEIASRVVVGQHNSRPRQATDCGGSDEGGLKDEGDGPVDAAMVNEDEFSCLPRTDSVMSMEASSSVTVGCLERKEVIDDPASPCSLGELDTALMTNAATRAIQSDVHDDVCVSVPELNCRQDSLGSFLNTYSQFFSNMDESSEKKLDGKAKLSLSRSHVRSFLDRISQFTSHCWQPREKPQASLVSESRPAWSRWHSIRLPKPVTVLKCMEKDNTHKSVAFSSKELEHYLRQAANRYVLPASEHSALATLLKSEGLMDSLEELLQRACGEHIPVVNDDLSNALIREIDDSDAEDDDRESYELSRKVDPDFDEVEGIVFVAFPSEMGIKAHSVVEKALGWEHDLSASLSMAKWHAFEAARRRDRKAHLKSQGLRGQHMKWRKYQRLYRQELQKLYKTNDIDFPPSLTKLSEKLSHVSQMKSLKGRYVANSDGVKCEDQQTIAALLEFGKVDEPVKRKRKTYVFSKKKRPKRAVSSAALDEQTDGDNCQLLVPDGPDDSHGSPIPISEDNYMQDVNAALREVEIKLKGFCRTKGGMLLFNWGPEDRHVLKKLGGWNTRLRRFRFMPPEMKGGDRYPRLPRRRLVRKQTPCFDLAILTSSDVSKAVIGVRNVKTSHAMQNSARDVLRPECGSVTVENSAPSDLICHEIVTSGDFVSECNKPGCRYGCICHLFMDGEQAFAHMPMSRRVCNKAYCSQGCICDTSPFKAYRRGSCSGDQSRILASSDDVSSPTVSKAASHMDFSTIEGGGAEEGSHPSHIMDYNVGHGGEDDDGVVKFETGDLGESSEDDIPSLEKSGLRRKVSMERFSDLPRRQSSYRVAKNLDAVSRKAMMMYKTSEVYSEQIAVRRKRLPDTFQTLSESAVMDFLPSTDTQSAPSELDISPSCGADVSPLPAGRIISLLSATGVSASAVSSVSAADASPSSSSAITVSPSASAIPSSPTTTPSDSVTSPWRPLFQLKTEPLSPLAVGRPIATAQVLMNTNLGMTANGTKLCVTVAKARQSTPLRSGRSAPMRKVPVMVGSLKRVDDSPGVSSQPAVKRQLEDMNDSTVVIDDLDVQMYKEETLPKSAHHSTSNTIVSHVASSRPLMMPSKLLISASTPHLSVASGSHCSQRSIGQLWHTSLICLKAQGKLLSASGRDNIGSGGDLAVVEDEIKLFEFRVNCDWERAKNDILKAITQSLVRGLYPEPRVMHVKDFRVEILPKASRPCSIPVQLRSKLPKAMFSVRVQITRLNPIKIPVCITARTLISSIDSIRVSKSSSTVCLTPLHHSTPLSNVCLTPLHHSTPLSNVCLAPLHHSTPLSNVVSRTGSSVVLCTVHSTEDNFPIQYPSVANPAPFVVVKSQPVSAVSLLKPVRFVDVSSNSSKPAVPSEVERRKRKRKKRRENSDVGFDSLMPDLCKLTVSPSKSSDTSRTDIPAPVLSVASPSSCCKTRLANFLPLRTNPTILPFDSSSHSIVVHQVPPTSTIRSSASSGSESKCTGSAAVTSGIKPQFLGLMPSGMNNVKFLQLPGPNGLVQLIPAAMLPKLKVIEGKRMPNVYAVPISVPMASSRNADSVPSVQQVALNLSSKLVSTPASTRRPATASARSASNRKHALGRGQRNPVEECLLSGTPITVANSVIAAPMSRRKVCRPGSCKPTISSVGGCEADRPNARRCTSSKPAKLTKLQLINRSSTPVTPTTSHLAVCSSLIPIKLCNAIPPKPIHLVRNISTSAHLSASISLPAQDAAPRPNTTGCLTVMSAFRKEVSIGGHCSSIGGSSFKLHAVCNPPPVAKRNLASSSARRVPKSGSSLRRVSPQSVNKVNLLGKVSRLMPLTSSSECRMADEVRDSSHVATNDTGQWPSMEDLLSLSDIEDEESSCQKPHLVQDSCLEIDLSTHNEPPGKGVAKRRDTDNGKHHQLSRLTKTVFEQSRRTQLNQGLTVLRDILSCPRDATIVKILNNTAAGVRYLKQQTTELSDKQTEAVKTKNFLTENLIALKVQRIAEGFAAQKIEADLAEIANNYYHDNCLVPSMVRKCRSKCGRRLCAGVSRGLAKDGRGDSEPLDLTVNSSTGTCLIVTSNESVIVSDCVSSCVFRHHQSSLLQPKNASLPVSQGTCTEHLIPPGIVDSLRHSTYLLTSSGPASSIDVASGPVCSTCPQCSAN